MYILSLTCAPLRCALGSSRRLRKRKLTRWRRVVRVRGRGELRRAEKEFFGAVGRVGVGAEQELFFFNIGALASGVPCSTAKTWDR